MKKLYRLLFVLHIFVGIGAMFGGMAAILNPLKPLGVSSEALQNSPFQDYLIPGVILFTIIGLGNLIAAVAIHLKSRFVGYTSSVFSWALVIWILVQVIILKGVHFLHILYFIIGAIGAAIAARVLFEKRLFPANIIMDFYKKISKEA